ncbi:MAG: hypothetical protein ACJA13_002647 [Paraglaciecola sp.]|jgi:hypothetical protein
MSTLTELSNSQHQDLKLKPEFLAEFASTQQIIRLRAVEVGKAVTSFPVFFTRNAYDGSWVLSALSSFENGRNLFVDKNQWSAIYQPTILQTYPFFLMQSSSDARGYTIGIDENSGAFSRETGLAVFEQSGAASLHLSKSKALLAADIPHDSDTIKFASQAEELGLLKGIDLVVVYADGATQTLSGLYTIDEDKLQGLSPSMLGELSENGYLIAIHGMLLSIYQLNLLLRKHNQQHNVNKISQLKIEVAKNRAAS